MKQKRRKKELAGVLAILLAFVSVMGFWAAPAKADGEPPEPTYEVSFTDGAVSGDTVTYTIEETPVTVTVSGAAITANKITVVGESAATFILGNTFDADTMVVKVYASDGFNTTLAVENNKETALDKRTNKPGGLPTTLRLVVEAKDAGGNDGGNGGNNPGGGDEATGASHPASYYTGEAKTATWTMEGYGDFYINGVMAETSSGFDANGEPIPVESGTITYNLAADGKAYFEFTSLFITRYTYIEINGVDYSSYIPDTTDEILEAIDVNGNSQTVNVILLGITPAASYEVTVSRKQIDDSDKDFLVIGNFLWSYLDQDAGTDDYIGHGHLAFESVSYGGNTYSSLAALQALDRPSMSFDEFNEGQEGGAVFPYGAELTVRLIPDYGYPLTSFTINGGEFTPGEEIGVYTFTIQKGNFHLGAHFTAVADSVKATASQRIAGGGITLGNGELAMGSAVLTVTDAVPTEDEETDFSEAAEGYTVNSYLDLDLNQVIYKGSAASYWSNDMPNLNHAATVSLRLSSSLSNSGVEVIHQKHDGGYEVIPATFNASTNTVSFDTDSFSKYAIAYKARTSSDSSGSNSSENTTKPEPAKDTKTETPTVEATQAEESTKTNVVLETEQEELTVGTVVAAEDTSGATVDYRITGEDRVAYNVSDTDTAGSTLVVPNTVTINGETFKVTRVSANALQGDINITEVKLGSNIKVIGKNAFRDCKNLETIVIGKRVNEIGKNAFKGISKNAVIKIKATSKSAYKAMVKKVRAAGAVGATFKYVKVKK